MKLYLASGNAHKAQELQALAGALRGALEVLSARVAGGMPHVDEDTGTFMGNARKKALALRAKLAASGFGADGWVLADDSGLCVDALDGGPGVESAYYAGPQGDGAANLAKLVDAMRDVPGENRGAHFYCVLFLIGPDGAEHVFEGRCPGRLVREPRGGGGFGYDPLFVPDGHERTFSELDETAKNKLSHRGRAWVAMERFLDTVKDTHAS